MPEVYIGACLDNKVEFGDGNLYQSNIYLASLPSTRHSIAEGVSAKLWIVKSTKPQEMYHFSKLSAPEQFE